MRRRLRFLRKARELAYRDLGGLVFTLHRFGERNDALVLGKLSALTEVDSEVHELETALKEHRSVTVLHEAGVTACPRCAAIHSAEDHFCPNCGLPMRRHVDLPIAGASGSPTPGATPDSGEASVGVAAAPGAAPAAGASGASESAGAIAARPTPAAPAAAPTTGRWHAPSSEPGQGGAPVTPVRAPGSGPAPPIPSADRPPSAPSTEPPAPPPPPAVPAEDQPTKVIRPGTRSKWRPGSWSK
jgi:hypothetical protein